MKHRRLAAAAAVLALAIGTTAPALAATATEPTPLFASLLAATDIDQNSISVTVTPAGGGINTEGPPQTYNSLAEATINPGDNIRITLTATPAALTKHRYVPVFLADYWQSAPPQPFFPPYPLRPAHLSGALLSSASPTATLSLTALPPNPYLPSLQPQPIVSAQLVLGVGLPLPLLTDRINYNTLPRNRAIQQAPITLTPTLQPPNA